MQRVPSCVNNSPWSGARHRSSRAVLLHTLHEFSQPAMGDTYLFLIFWWPFHTEKRKTGDYVNAQGTSPNGRFPRTIPQIAVAPQCWGLLREGSSSVQRMDSMKCTECTSLWGRSSPHQVAHQCPRGWTECVNVGSRQTEDQGPGEFGWPVCNALFRMSYGAPPGGTCAKGRREPLLQHQYLCHIWFKVLIFRGTNTWGRRKNATLQRIATHQQA